MVHAKRRHGKVTEINETTGTTESFNVKVGEATRVDHRDAMSTFEMVSKEDSAVGALVTVKRTFKSMAIPATKLRA